MTTLRWLFFMIFAALLVAQLSSCSKPKPTTIAKAYFFWRTDDATWQERKFIKSHGIEKLYMRVLDVDWVDVQGAIPVASNHIEPTMHQLLSFDTFKTEFIPVVFLTNKTFQRIDSSDLPELAKRVIRRCLPAFDDVDKRYEQNHFQHGYGELAAPREILFDCDWTNTTAPRYFAFLKEIKNLLPSDSIKITATIRLHQFRHPEKTGVPPVNRGMLMAYNISDPTSYGNDNSIFEEKKAKPYFNSSKKYPLPLDMALPAWSWCIVYRNKKFYQIENQLDEEDLKQQSFLQASDSHRYAVTMDTVFNNLFLRRGDEIKAEGIDSSTLMEAAQLAQKAGNTDSFTVSLFELSEKEINHYSSETVDQVFRSFH